MLRDQSLIPLSHQHQHALALCVRIERASPIAEDDLPEWRAEIEEIFRSEIVIHFVAEEEIVFPAATEFSNLNPLVKELLADHAWLRQRFARGPQLSSVDVSELAKRLSGHIRKEERQLFEGMQERLSREQLTVLGQKLEQTLRNSAESCLLPNEKTRLRAAK
ncbi:MAG TPA: hemerythrin domain-containing protein [Candidatus Sulfotelmatobacter sp.]|nr:hemerythrin domain-containing protein [Candidatus Sulfotelmatobacter sp.]